MAYLGRSVNQDFFFGASDEIKARAKDLRKKTTISEKYLWKVLRGTWIQKFHFRRQHPISRFIADFYCHELRLVIELDGDYHQGKEQQEKDLNRTAELENLGIRVIRIKNEEIRISLKKIAEKLGEEIRKRQIHKKNRQPPNYRQFPAL